MATFNEDMVAKLQALLLANPGAQSVTVDGQSVAYADLIARLDFFEKKLAQENGTQPLLASINLGGSK